MENSKVFHVAPYYPPNLGGLQAAVKDLATAQAAEGKDVTVITSNVPAESATLKSSKLKIHRLFTIEFAHIPFMPNLLLFMLSKIRSSDIIHLHFAQPFLSEIVLLEHFIKRTPYVFHFHGDVLPSGRFGRLLSPYKKYVLPHSLKHASRIIFPSLDFRDRIIQKYPFIKAGRTVIIPNGIVMPAPLRQDRHDLRYFIYVGRLAKIKNVAFIIGAFHQARKQNPALKLLIVGSGELDNDLKERVSKLNEDASIEFYGESPRDDLDKLYKYAIAALVASDRESFGMSIVEAMSYGIPVIACDAPGVRELVKHEVNGFLVEKTPDAYAKAIIACGQAPGVRVKLSAGATKTAEQYSIKSTMRAWDKVYEEGVSS